MLLPETPSSRRKHPRMTARTTSMTPRHSKAPPPTTTTTSTRTHFVADLKSHSSSISARRVRFHDDDNDHDNRTSLSPATVNVPSTPGGGAPRRQQRLQLITLDDLEAGGVPVPRSCLVATTTTSPSTVTTTTTSRRRPSKHNKRHGGGAGGSPQSQQQTHTTKSTKISTLATTTTTTQKKKKTSKVDRLKRRREYMRQQLQKINKRPLKKPSKLTRDDLRRLEDMLARRVELMDLSERIRPTSAEAQQQQQQDEKEQQDDTVTTRDEERDETVAVLHIESRALLSLSPKTTDTTKNTCLTVKQDSELLHKAESVQVKQSFDGNADADEILQQQQEQRRREAAAKLFKESSQRLSTVEGYSSVLKERWRRDTEEEMQKSTKTL